jgi:GTPase SAR1 family protein
MTTLSTLPNPFDGNVVPDAWSAPAVDVASIHQAPFQQCLRALDSAGRGNSDSILIFGPAGSGKTHLLARLQEHLVATANAAPDGTLRCVFVSVKLQTNAQLIWQHVRRRLTSDLLRKQQGLTQLQRLVAHQVAAQLGEPPKRWVRALRVLTGTNGESVTDYLQQVAQRLELSRGLCIALDHLVHNRFIMDATAWLCGDSLPESALGRLGLGAEEQEDREEAARQVVTALCRLAGETLPIVFCFDQIEALQQGSDDRDSLFRFGRMAADLSEADRNVLLISCVQSAFVDLLNASVRDADRDRIFKRRSVLEPLTREQVEALIVHRLDSVEAPRSLRRPRPACRAGCSQPPPRPSSDCNAESRSCAKTPRPSPRGSRSSCATRSRRDARARSSTASPRRAATRSCTGCPCSGPCRAQSRACSDPKASICSCLRIAVRSAWRSATRRT